MGINTMPVHNTGWTKLETKKSNHNLCYTSKRIVEIPYGTGTGTSFMTAGFIWVPVPI
jgi:hypothetical protein